MTKIAKTHLNAFGLELPGRKKPHRATKNNHDGPGRTRGGLPSPLRRKLIVKGLRP